MELTKKKQEDERTPVVVGRGELRSGETRPRRRRRKNGQWPSPMARMARLGGRRGRGGHGGALVELWFAFLRRRAGASAAELARQQWRGIAALLLCFGRAEEQRKMWHRGALDGVLGLQLPSSGPTWPDRLAIGDARRHAAVKFCNRSDYCSIDSVKTISLTALLDGTHSPNP